jgi:hypothetical protein
LKDLANLLLLILSESAGNSPGTSYPPWQTKCGDLLTPKDHLDAAKHQRTGAQPQPSQSENPTPLSSSYPLELPPEPLSERISRAPRLSTIKLSKLPSLRRSFTGQLEDRITPEPDFHPFSRRRTVGYKACSLFDKTDIAVSDDDTASESSFSSSSTEFCDRHEELDIIGQYISKERFTEHLAKYFRSFPASSNYRSCLMQRPWVQENVDQDLPQSEPSNSSETMETAKAPSQMANRRGQRRENENDRISENEDGDGRKKKKRKKDEDDHCEKDTKFSLYLRPLACPYYQRNPRRYRHQRGCAGPGWKDVHRLK